MCCLESANLNGANLQSADIEGAKLTKAELVGVNLSGVNISAADTADANIRINVDEFGADVRNIIKLHRQWIDSFGKEGAQARLDGEDFSYVVFDNLNLSGASIKGAALSGASFRRCNLTMADLSSSNLKEALDEGAEASRFLL